MDHAYFAVTDAGDRVVIRSDVKLPLWPLSQELDVAFDYNSGIAAAAFYARKRHADFVARGEAALAQLDRLIAYTAAAYAAAADDDARSEIVDDRRRLLRERDEQAARLASDREAANKFEFRYSDLCRTDPIHA